MKWIKQLLIRLGFVAPPVIQAPVVREAPKEDHDWFFFTPDDVEHERILSERLTTGVCAARFFKTTFATKEQRNLAVRWMNTRKELDTRPKLRISEVRKVINGCQN